MQMLIPIFKYISAYNTAINILLSQSFDQMTVLTLFVLIPPTLCIKPVAKQL